MSSDDTKASGEWSHGAGPERITWGRATGEAFRGWVDGLLVLGEDGDLQPLLSGTVPASLDKLLRKALDALAREQAAAERDAFDARERGQ